MIDISDKKNTKPASLVCFVAFIIAVNFSNFTIKAQETSVYTKSDYISENPSKIDADKLLIATNLSSGHYIYVVTPKEYLDRLYSVSAVTEESIDETELSPVEQEEIINDMLMRKSEKIKDSIQNKTGDAEEVSRPASTLDEEKKTSINKEVMQIKRSDTIRIIATAYSSTIEDCGKTDGITADGRKARWGLIAAPRDIPFGTRIEVKGMGIFTVADRGSAIRRVNSYTIKIDIWFPTRAQAIKFGRRTFVGRILR